MTFQYIGGKYGTHDNNRIGDSCNKRDQLFAHQKYNKYLRRNHGKRIITHEMAAVIAIPLILWIAFLDFKSFWNWVLFALAAFLFVFTLHGVISRCRQLRAK